MTKNEKLDILRVWLHDHYITYNEEYNLDGVNLALWIPLYRIGVIDDEAKANDSYPHLTQNHVRMFVVRKNEDKDFIISKMNNCVRDQRLKKALHYCWSHFDRDKKRKYKGTYPLNFGRFKKEFNIYLAEAQGDINDTLHLYFPKAPKI